MLVTDVDVTGFDDFDQHNTVVRCTHKATGLIAFIAIHNLNLGPSLGGCRVFPYASETAAITDVLRLSRGMTYKAALANLKLGGGKSVIIADAKTDKTPEMMRTMGRFVETLGGKYIIAQDSGTDVDDLEWIASQTAHSTGVKTKQLSDGTISGRDPSPSTAYGVFVGIKATVKARFGEGELSGLKVAVQGVGNVGRNLVQLLLNAGVDVLVSDTYQPAIDRVVEIGKVRVVDNAAIHRQAVDVFSPCALGSALNMTTLIDMRAPIIAGAANNQLASRGAGEYLFRKQVLYAPDYVINAGGIIDLFYEGGAYNHKQVIQHIDGISDTLGNIYGLSKQHNKPTFEMADRLAESVFLDKPMLVTPHSI